VIDQFKHKLQILKTSVASYRWKDAFVASLGYDLFFLNKLQRDEVKIFKYVAWLSHLSAFVLALGMGVMMYFAFK
jgi:hypothetical protein